MRVYGPPQAFLDQTWKPGDLVKQASPASPLAADRS
ncbi:hypothetical protein PLUA15_110040 [Pseudomonas lundensis]|uniref:Uncharacterized protein n=1 Tax=Pseudomonas lundensis TaxID=86185 RepID=A0AAX2H1R1_9PSED|nr:hypothetical protein PLUA15_110040 [Pseudomonas lundensis]